MTENEAIKIIMSKACNDRCDEIHCDDSCMYGANKCAFQMAIKALEKQIPKEPKVHDYKHIMYSQCPICGEMLRINQPFCDGCGQKLDWEGGE